MRLQLADLEQRHRVRHVPVAAAVFRSALPHAPSDTRLFDVILPAVGDLSEHAARRREKRQREEHAMIDPHAKRPCGNRRDFLQERCGRRAAPTGCRGAGMGRRGNSSRVRRLQVPARGARAEPEIGRRAAHRHHDAPAAFRHPSVGHDQHPRRDGGHVRQPRSGAIRATGQDDHPRSGAELGHRQGRQDLHVLPAQRCGSSTTAPS